MILWIYDTRNGTIHAHTYVCLLVLFLFKKKYIFKITYEAKSSGQCDIQNYRRKILSRENVNPFSYFITSKKKLGIRLKLYESPFIGKLSRRTPQTEMNLFTTRNIPPLLKPALQKA